MSINTGSNFKDIKLQNRCLVLKLIATVPLISRNSIAQTTDLSKMTMSNIISELVSLGMVKETKCYGEANSSVAGRKPSMLDIADTSPCVCGIFIGRKFCTVTIADLKARILHKRIANYPATLDAKGLLEIVFSNFDSLKATCNRPILGVGISAIGPLNAANGILLKPPNFFGIENLPIAALIREHTGCPVALMNDASSGALAEKLYGYGKEESNFLTILLSDGVGAGMIVDDQLFDGNIGLGGEIGHTSINFSGPRCDCGNRGCLETYANVQNVVLKAKELLALNKNSVLSNREHVDWLSIVNAADDGDGLAISVLDGFCDYVSYALVNYLNLLDSHTVFLGYECEREEGVIEKLLEAKVNSRLLASEFRSVRVQKSKFYADSPTIGSIAVITSQIFSGHIPFMEP